MKKENRVAFRLIGRDALFTDPLTKLGGEKFTYQIPTYQALKGICESIYWKPTMIWVVDRVRIIKPIRTQSKGIRPIHYQNNSNDLSIYTYLRDVEYQVEAHFEWNENRPDLSEDRNENKHYFIAKRMIERGGRRDIYLGTRECQGYVEPVEFGSGNGYYDGMNMSFGMMLHGITYPDEVVKEHKKGTMSVRFWQPIMVNGIVDFIRPEACTIINTVGKRDMKDFILEKNFSGLQEFKKEGETDALD
jgi:CRISPR-associated protein Cas5d